MLSRDVVLTLTHIEAPDATTDAAAEGRHPWRPRVEPPCKAMDGTGGSTWQLPTRSLACDEVRPWSDAIPFVAG